MHTFSLVALLLIGSSVLAAAPVYTSTEIRGPSDETLTATAVNNHGDVSGYSDSGAVVYLHRTRSAVLLPHPTPNSGDTATALNDYGKIGGTSTAFGQPQAAVVWYLNGGFEVLTQAVVSYVTGVSNNGQVTTTNVFLFHGNSDGVIWSWKPTLHYDLIPSFPDANCCYPFNTVNAINSAGHVVGDSTLSQVIDPSKDFIEGDHAYLYANGVLTDIGVLGNPQPSDSLGTSIAFGLNNRDDVVGESEVDIPLPNANCPSCIGRHAFFWHRGRLTDLGNLAHVPAWDSKANAINDAEEIVGSADANVAGSPTTRAFVYIDRTMYNLTFMVHHRDLNVRLVNAVDINCHGWIVANGYDVTNPGVNRAYLLIPKGASVREGCPKPRWN